MDFGMEGREEGKWTNLVSPLFDCLCWESSNFQSRTILFLGFSLREGNNCRCCPRSNVTRQMWRDLVREAKNLRFPDTSSCSLPHKKFKAEFIKQSKVGIIKNCSETWPAQEMWSIKGLLGRHDGKKLWKVNFVNRFILVS